MLRDEGGEYKSADTESDEDQGCDFNCVVAVVEGDLVAIFAERRWLIRALKGKKAHEL